MATMKVVDDPKPKIKNIPLHATVRVYNSDHYVVNGVKHEHIKSHIKYNTTNRFGCALFVDGVCHYTGYLDAIRIQEWEAKLKEDSKKRFESDPDFDWDTHKKLGQPIYRTQHAKIPYH